MSAGGPQRVRVCGRLHVRVHAWDMHADVGSGSAWSMLLCILGCYMYSREGLAPSFTCIHALLATHRPETYPGVGHVHVCKVGRGAMVFHALGCYAAAVWKQ